MLTAKFQKLYACTQNGVDLMRFCTHTYPPGFSAALNTYEYLKVLRVISGNGVWKINGQDYPIGVGDILMLNNTEPRALCNMDENEPLVLEYGTWLPSAVQCSGDCLGIYFNRSPGFRNLLSASNSMAGDIHHLFDLLSKYASLEAPLREDLMQQLLRTLFVVAAQAWRQEIPVPEREAVSHNSDYDVIAGTVQYITSHPAADLSESALAARVYMSKNRFIRLFRAYNGMTPAVYVRAFRVRYAMEQIQSGRASIAEAAMESGFGSLSGFYKAVATVTGSTPGGKMIP